MTVTLRLAAIMAVDVRLFPPDGRGARPRQRSAGIETRRGAWPTDAAFANGSFPPIPVIQIARDHVPQTTIGNHLVQLVGPTYCAKCLVVSEKNLALNRSPVAIFQPMPNGKG
jgi:hypothetical protein